MISRWPGQAGARRCGDLGRVDQDPPLPSRAVEDRAMRVPRVQLRTVMVAVAFLALALAVIVQSVRLNQALIREQQLRNEAELQRERAQRAEYVRMLAEAQAEWQRQMP